jgi:xanthine/uracil permease
MNQRMTAAAQRLVLGLQWVVFHLGIIVSVPIILGGGYELSQAQVGELMRLTFFVTGAGSLLQSWLGHQNMLIEGPAGPWWSAYLVIIGVAVSTGTPLAQVRTDIQGAMLVAGGVLFLLGISGALRKIRPIFTPRATGVFLLLIGMQISSLGFRRMVTSGLPLFLAGLGVLTLSLVLLVKAKGIVRHAAILLSVIVGWIAALSLGLTGVTSAGSTPPVALPAIFPWGLPTFDAGTALTLTLLGLFLIPNHIGSLRAMEAARSEHIPQLRYNRGLAVTGMIGMLTGAVGGIGTIPYAVSPGLVSMTGERRKGAFHLGALLFILIAVVTPLTALLSSIPEAIAGAILMIAMARVIVIGITDVTREGLTGMPTFAVGLGILAGTGIIFMPPDFWNALPSWAASVFSNGVIVGTFLTILLEQLLCGSGRPSEGADD